jgi:hypothetical protein
VNQKFEMTNLCLTVLSGDVLYDTIPDERNRRYEVFLDYHASVSASHMGRDKTDDQSQNGIFIGKACRKTLWILCRSVIFVNY